MQVMAKLLKDKNVLQMNIIDPQQGTNDTKAPSVENVQEKQEAPHKRRNVGGNDSKILKRNIVTTSKINSNDPRDIVFAILSEDARKRALEIQLSGVSSKEVTGMVLLQAYFRNSDVLNGFYGIPRSGANYI